MRFFNADDATFTDEARRTARLKDTIPMVGRAENTFEVQGSSDIALDEIATRTEAYGEGAESSAYRVFEENAVEIMENRLDMGKIKKLRVPL